MSSFRAKPLTRALDGGALPLHYRIRSVTSIFNFSARSANVRNCLTRAAPMWVESCQDIRLTASGTVEVIRVVQGLGYGLDEAARAVAMGIEFTPATQDGKPVDHISTVTVQFDLS